MKKSILPIAALLLAASTVPATAEALQSDNAKIDVFLSASRNMQKAINNNEDILKDLKLDAGKLEVMMPDEQFQQICNAISARYADELDKNAARQKKLGDAEKIFGYENANEIIPIVGNPAKIEDTRRQFREAYEVFAGYHSTQEEAAELSDWGWGDSWGFFINPSIGTLGVGIDIGYEFNKHFKIRGHYGSGSISSSGELSDATFNLEWNNNNNYGVFADWHPRGSQFRVTAGVLISDPRITMDTNYHGTTKAYDVSSGSPIPAQYDVYSDYTLRGSWRNRVQPYLGLGWSSDGGAKRTLFFSVDMGVAYMGDGDYKDMGEAKFYKNGAQITLATASASDLDALATLQQFDANVRDVVNKVAGVLNDMQVYPVLQFGFGIRF